MKHTNHSTRSKNRLVELLTRSRQIRIPPWVGLAVLIGLVVFVAFMKARQHAELREQWASPDRPAIVTIEARKQQFLALQEVEGLATDFASLLEDTAKLTHRLKKRGLTNSGCSVE